MSVLSRTRVAEAETTDTRGYMPLLARTTVLARAAVPMAKTAGMAARDGARSAATWAAPRVNGARAWTAPRIERSGLVIRDTIAPKICETLTATARRVDVPPRVVDATASGRRRLKVVAGTAMLAAAGAAAVVVLRRRKNDGTRGASGEAAEERTGPQAAQDGQQRAGADGRAAEEGVGPAPATDHDGERSPVD